MPAFKKLGIVGGMGSRAGAMLFSKIIDYSPAVKDQDFIEILLHSNSAVPDRTRAIVYKEESPVAEILRSVKLLNEQAVDIIVLACITSYFFFEEFTKFSRAEIIHPVKLIREHIAKNYSHIRKVGLLATTGTVSTGLFQKVFHGSGTELVLLSEKDQEELFMKSVYMKNGLKSSDISEEAKSLFRQAVPKLVEQGAELIIGGCTEVQIMMKEEEGPIPYVDAMDVTAREVVRRCYIPEPDKKSYAFS